jgi:hypothetical protein
LLYLAKVLILGTNPLLLAPAQVCREVVQEEAERAVVVAVALAVVLVVQ